MSEKVFPRQEVIGDIVVTEGGMDLRDWFAGQALAGLCANPYNSKFSARAIVDSAYDLADCAMERRKK